MSNRFFQLTVDILLRAYAAGIFPMAESAESKELHWFDPPLRAIIPLDNRFHVSRRLARTLRQHSYMVKLDSAFDATLRTCAMPTPSRPITWINDEIIRLYTTLHIQGNAHSIEVWQDGKLTGGLYGVNLGGAFFGESMFSRADDTSKIALVYLVALLRHSGFSLLDTQFQTEHLSQFGTIELTRENYHHLLNQAVKEKNTTLQRLDFNVWHHLACGLAGVADVGAVTGVTGC